MFMAARILWNSEGLREIKQTAQTYQLKPGCTKFIKLSRDDSPDA